MAHCSHCQHAASSHGPGAGPCFHVTGTKLCTCPRLTASAGWGPVFDRLAKAHEAHGQTGLAASARRTAEKARKARPAAPRAKKDKAGA
jgi:hypothetical protein